MSFTESMADIVEANTNGLLAKHETWERVRLEQICTILNGFPFPSEKFNSSKGFPLIRIRDVARGRTETRFNGEFDNEYVVRKGELVVGMDGDFNARPWRNKPALLNQRVCKLTPDLRFYCGRFLAYAIQGYLDAINAKTSAITVKHLSSKTITEIPLPLPSLEEQERLSDFLDEKFSDLDDAVATLERVKRNLERYRASVLKAAVEGRLVPTEAELARAEGRGYEPASILLDRILAERRRRWEEAELAKMKAKGKTPKGDKWKAKYEEPVAPDTSGLPELPEGWCWASPDEIAAHEDYSLGIGPFGSNLKVNDYREKGVPLIFVRNIRSETFDGTRTKYVTEEKAIELTPHVARGGDLLITKMGEPPGDVSIYPKMSHNGIITADCIRLRPYPYSSSAKFLMYAMRSPVFREQIVRVTKGVAQKKVSLLRFKSTAIPIAPVQEQIRVSIEVDRLLSVAETTLHIAEREVFRCRRLRQAILKWAFEGKLADQDPNDEPASALLKRIKAERANTPKKTKGRKKGKHT